MAAGVVTDKVLFRAAYPLISAAGQGCKVKYLDHPLSHDDLQEILTFIHGCSVSRWILALSCADFPKGVSPNATFRKIFDAMERSLKPVFDSEITVVCPRSIPQLHSSSRETKKVIRSISQLLRRRCKLSNSIMVRISNYTCVGEKATPFELRPEADHLMKMTNPSLPEVTTHLARVRIQ